MSKITSEIGYDPYPKPDAYNGGLMKITAKGIINDKIQFLFYQVMGINYTLKKLSTLSFERWAELIELENEINNTKKISHENIF